MTKQLFELFLSTINFDDYPEFNITITGITSDGEEDILMETLMKNPGLKKSKSKKGKKKDVSEDSEKRSKKKHKRRKSKKSKKSTEIEMEGTIEVNDMEIDLSKIKYARLANTYTAKKHREIIEHFTNGDPDEYVYLGSKTKKQLVNMTVKLVKKWKKNNSEEKDEEIVNEKSINLDNVNDVSSDTDTDN